MVSQIPPHGSPTANGSNSRSRAWAAGTGSPRRWWAATARGRRCGWIAGPTTSATKCSGSTRQTLAYMNDGTGPRQLSWIGELSDAAGSPLALLVYGRRDLSSLAWSGALKLRGDLTLADRFATTFSRP